MLSFLTAIPISAEVLPPPGTKIETIRETTRIKIPKNYSLKKNEELIFNGSDFQLTLYAEEFKPGDAVYFEILPKKDIQFSPEHSAEFSFNRRVVPLTKFQWGYRGIFGLEPNYKKSSGQIKVTTTIGKKKQKYTYQLKLKKAKFPVFYSSLDLGNYSDVNQFKNRPDLLEEIASYKKKKKLTFARRSQDFISSALSHPRDFHFITSPFYALRVIKQYIVKNGKQIEKKSRAKRHIGTDFKGGEGEKIFAVANGETAIAEPMYFEGNHTVIDHGQGIFSSYMHQNKIYIKEGEMVKTGQAIGEVGKTGSVTGPHLHISIYIRNIPVDVLSFISLPIRGE